MNPTEIADKLESHASALRKNSMRPGRIGDGGAFDETISALDAAVAALRAGNEPKLRATEPQSTRHIAKEVEALGYWMQEIAAQVRYFAGFEPERVIWANKIETAGVIVQGWGLSWCTKCGGTMAPGVAMGQTATGSRDDLGVDVVTMSPGGPGKLIDCMKCAACGHSVSR